VTHVLDDAIGASLRGPHSAFALAADADDAIRYPSDVAPFASVGLSPTASGWKALRALLGDAHAAMFVVPGFAIPGDWNRTAAIGLSQLTDDAVDLESFRSADRSRLLGPSDVPEMLRLTAQTRPGPFEARTAEFGGYRGIFDGDELVAMAGRRLNPPGWVEISAVCTDPRYRGRGYARELVLDVLRGIRADGQRGFLHVAHGNPARAVYESLGFVTRRDFEVAVVEPA